MLTIDLNAVSTVCLYGLLFLVIYCLTLIIDELRRIAEILAEGRHE